jgi:hypothetical protein
MSDGLCVNLDIAYNPHPPQGKDLERSVLVSGSASRKMYFWNLEYADTAEISTDILCRWSKKSKLSLPSISELPRLLDKPLSHDEKIPLTRIQFDNLLSGLTEVKDICHRDDVERLFRISDSEASEALHLIFYNAAVQPAPPEDGTEASFISFWDDNIRKILELLVPSGKSIRGSSCHTNTQKSRPDYGFLKNNVCSFRGEEKPPESRDDPKAELSYKLTWTYSPAPYVFGEYNYSSIICAFLLITIFVSCRVLCYWA